MAGNQEAQEVGRRFESLPAQRLLRLLHADRSVVFRPVFDSERGIVAYPDVEKATELEGRRVRELLDFFADNGILQKEESEAFYTCPNCESSRLVPRISCPSCKSGSLKLGEGIEHVKCGYIDLEEAFVTKEGFVCPKCSKPLKKLGEDYRKLVGEYKCRNCGKLTRVPNQSFLCTSCQALTPLEAVRFEVYYSYRLNPEGVTKVSKYALDLGLVRRFLQERGFESRQNVTLKGRSEIQHQVDMIAWHSARSVEEKPDIIIDVVISETQLGVEALAAFMIKLVDLGAKEAVLVSVPDASKQASRLASFYGIALKGCKTLSEVPNSINEILAERIPALMKRLEGGEEVAPAPKKVQQQAPHEADDKTEILLTMIYERQNESQRAMKKLLEQIESRDQKLEELFKKLLESRAASLR